MNLKRIALVSITVLLAAAALYFIFGGRQDDGELLTQVKRDSLRIEITVRGELMARTSTLVPGPANLVSLSVYDIKIQSLLPEGTPVRRGDTIATLDPKVLDGMVRKAEEDHQASQVRLEELLLDTTQALKELRDQVMSQEFEAEEARIAILQSVYEDRATKQKAQNDFNKAGRSLENARAKYDLEKRKAENRVRNAKSACREANQLSRELQSARDSLVIRAPGPGMLVYHRSRQTGDKVVAGTMLTTTFDFIIAEIPDLQGMKSVTGVNETDIDKIRTGQPVAVSVDAFPGKTFAGKVAEVANMGMEDPASGAKVFEVVILLDAQQPVLRPGMTSKNTIVTAVHPNVLLVPLEAVFGAEGTGPFVYLKSRSGLVRRTVETGPSGDALIVIRSGLQAGDFVSLSEPP